MVKGTSRLAHLIGWLRSRWIVKVPSDGKGQSRWLKTQQDGQVYEHEVWSQMGP